MSWKFGVQGDDGVARTIGMSDDVGFWGTDGTFSETFLTPDELLGRRKALGADPNFMEEAAAMLDVIGGRLVGFDQNVTQRNREAVTEALAHYLQRHG